MTRCCKLTYNFEFLKSFNSDISTFIIYYIVCNYVKSEPYLIYNLRFQTGILTKYLEL